MYEIPGTDIGLTQGDILVECPIVDWIPSTPGGWEPQQYTQKVIVLTQACDLENYLLESIVDFRDVHTVPRELLEQNIQTGKRLIRLQTPYREHLAQHFAVTFSRIALPVPYQTKP